MDALHWFFDRGEQKGFGVFPMRLELTREAERDIMLAIIWSQKLFNSEISGLGEIEQSGLCFRAQDIIVPKQFCHGGETTFFAQEMEHTHDTLREQGKDPSRYMLWWHSHVQGKARFSAIDNHMIKEYLRGMLTGVHAEFFPHIPEETVAGPFLSLVGNVFGEMDARCDFIYRRSGQHWFQTVSLPVVRHLIDEPAKIRSAFLRERLTEMRSIVEHRITPIVLRGNDD